MKLNLPFLDTLNDCERILIAGAGGGFDFLGGIPVYQTLKEMGKEVHIANYSFIPLGLVSESAESIELIDELLIGATSKIRFPNTYSAEHYFCEWYQKTFNEEINIWMFADTGVVPLKQAYEKLIDHLGGIDALILFDGGVDSLMRGDEEGAGTYVEDTITLAAIKDIDIPVKILGCIGFGTEIEERVSHYDALQNMADFIRDGGFLGCCALTKDMPAFQHYAAAGRYIWEQPDHHQSHIHTRVIPAVEGEFGDYHMYSSEQRRWPVRLFVSALMSIYWFFDVDTVIAHNLLLPKIMETTTKNQVVEIALRDNPTRPYQDVPL